MSEWLNTFPGYGFVLGQLKRGFGKVIQTGPTPKHVGLIMDGNRRYAKSHKIELKEGHNLGFESMANILELLYEAGVQCATVYAFSIENFKRLSYEVEWLMDLAKEKFKQISQHGELCEQYGIRIHILGNTALLPKDVQRVLRETEEMTKNNRRAVLNVCFPYTSRDEITHAIKSTIHNYSPRQISEHELERHLFTHDAPPLDLLVRTSGTYRLSDFLLWQGVSPQCAVVFCEKLWPDFTPWDMCKILVNWSFNKYWYNHGNGATTTKILPPVARSHVKDSESSYDSDSEAVDVDHDSATSDEDTLTVKQSK